MTITLSDWCSHAVVRVLITQDSPRVSPLPAVGPWPLLETIPGVGLRQRPCCFSLPSKSTESLGVWAWLDSQATCWPRNCVGSGRKAT